jgi:catechol 2,3-dioxygenase-like lactoylglutathione lyase family enzyme
MWLPKTHIRLGVDNAAHSAVFYEALLGAPPAHRSENLAVFEFDSPPLILTVEECSPARRSKIRRSSRPQARGAPPEEPAPLCKQGKFALFVAEPNQVGDTAIRLRRAGIRLRVEDQGIEAHDPDGNAWRVRFVPKGPVHAAIA